jgi:hypothetical protein
MSPGSRETPKGFIGDSHNPIIQSLIDTGAVDFNAIGRAVAEVGPSVGSLRASGEDWFCKVYHSFIHIYILRKVATLAELATLREMGTELQG